MTFAAYYPDLTGQPWEALHDARLRADWQWGCGVFIMAKRALRSEAEVSARLEVLGLSMANQPKPKIRSTTWARRNPD